MSSMQGQAVHPVLGLANYTAREMSIDPDRQVAQTLGVMCERVQEDAKDLEFVQRLFSLGLVGRTQRETCERVWEHAKQNIKFQRDEVTGLGVGGFSEQDIVEVIIRPQDMARYVDQGVATGDCDDFSMYVAALLTAAGVPCAFVTCAADARDPSQFSHVYVAAYPGGDRFVLDSSHGPCPGWEVRGFGRLQEWPVTGQFVIGFVSSVVAAFAAVWLWHKFGNGALV